jgi:hypothetical protein
MAGADGQTQDVNALALAIGAASKRIRALSAEIISPQTIDVYTLKAAVGDDIDAKTLRLADGQSVQLAHARGIVDPEQLEARVLSVLRQVGAGSVAAALPYASPLTGFNDARRALLGGHAVVVGPGGVPVLGIDVAKPPVRTVSGPKSVTALAGSQLAFIEDLDTNIGLLRSILPSPDLRIAILTAGRISQTRVAVAYVAGLCRPRFVRAVVRGVRTLPVDKVKNELDVGAFLVHSTYTPFPLSERTELVNLAARALTSGRVITLVHGSPFSLNLPATLFSIIMTGNTPLGSPVLGMFVGIVRILAMIGALVAPALYAALMSVDPGIMPPQLMGAVAAARQGLPYPVLVEALVQLFILDAITIAAEVAPGSLGQALTIVGSLIIGQAAVSAHLTSSIMVIVLSLVLVGNLLVQDLRLAYALRLIKYPLVVLGGTLGVVGIQLGLLVLTVHLVSLKSLGVPYLSTLAPIRWRRLSSQGIWQVPRPQQRLRPAAMRPLETKRW